MWIHCGGWTKGSKSQWARIVRESVFKLTPRQWWFILFRTIVCGSRLRTPFGLAAGVAILLGIVDIFPEIVFQSLQALFWLKLLIAAILAVCSPCHWRRWRASNGNRIDCHTRRLPTDDPQSVAPPPPTLLPPAVDPCRSVAAAPSFLGPGVAPRPRTHRPKAKQRHEFQLAVVSKQSTCPVRPRPHRSPSVDHTRLASLPSIPYLSTLR